MKAKKLHELVTELSALLPQYADMVISMEGCDCNGPAGEVVPPKNDGSDYDCIEILRATE